MDPRLLDLYNQELKFIRETAAEFAQEYPKVAARLGLEGFDCADPYVERLLEGFAFLTAKIQLQLGEQFPHFTENLLNHLFPTFLMPTPSMAICQFEPDREEGSLLAGMAVARGTSLSGGLSKGEQTSCEYKTVQAFTLYPLTISRAEYLNAQSVSALDTGQGDAPRHYAAIELTLTCDPLHRLADIDADRLELYLRGPEALPMHLFALLYTGFDRLNFRESDKAGWQTHSQPVTLECTQLTRDKALMPYNPRYFDGFRLLREYFLFPKRFLFLTLAGLRPILQRIKGHQVQLLLLLSREEPRLENLITADNFSLFCVPAINLFSRKTDRIKICEGQSEYHVVADKLRPCDYEICDIETLSGFSAGVQQQTHFSPFYSSNPRGSSGNYFAVKRKARKLTAKQKNYRGRSSYIGTETYIDIVEQQHAGASPPLSQLAVTALCSNRDLPILMPVGKGDTDFSLDISLPCQRIRCLEGPTRPAPPIAGGDMNWEIISQLSFNYLGFDNKEPQAVTSALKQLMSLFADKNDVAAARQIEGISAVNFTPATRRIPLPGPICFARGLAIELVLDEASFEGSGVFLLALVLEQFFARLVSINSFTQLTLSTTDNKEIYTWPVRMGMKTSL
ncbi:type VI secretion system baseplate subunit TssF [Thalassomonas viridans]|uniref:Type VI secretion system baseplate subunit TssF n=1 Tax=Thalassomonas viridans TaxID=137584 RepID=A0AAE9Z6S1_9GAMM|nr:type VI secretion system baseplate subunit TssF [Thalassomonas viridans]WDE07780.1 type VI secretion system baseplate subunit TssF [Thalassomonas viridans]